MNSHLGTDDYDDVDDSEGAVQTVYSAPASKKEFDKTQIQMDAYVQVLDDTGAEVKKTLARLKRFVDTKYPELQPDRESDWHKKDYCEISNKKFTLFDRRHHCRMCARSVCGEVSQQRREIRAWCIDEKVRVCDPCAKGLDKSQSLFTELSWEYDSEDIRAIFRIRQTNDWKDMVEYLGLEWGRAQEADFVKLKTQYEQMENHQKEMQGLRQALESGKMKIQLDQAGKQNEIKFEPHTKARQVAIYGPPSSRTADGKALDKASSQLKNKLKENIDKAVQRQQKLSKLADDTGELADASQEFRDRAKRLKDILAAKNSFW